MPDQPGHLVWWNDLICVDGESSDHNLSQVEQGFQRHLSQYSFPVFKLGCYGLPGWTAKWVKSWMDD